MSTDDRRGWTPRATHSPGLTHVRAGFPRAEGNGRWSAGAHSGARARRPAGSPAVGKVPRAPLFRPSDRDRALAINRTPGRRFRSQGCRSSRARPAVIAGRSTLDVIAPGREGECCSDVVSGGERSLRRVQRAP
ncbi:hypothetical protein MRX96_005249 [Rhipicephalus microplus]